MEALRFDLTVLRGALRQRLKNLKEVEREASDKAMGIDTIIRLLAAGYLQG